MSAGAAGTISAHGVWYTGRCAVVTVPRSIAARACGALTGMLDPGAAGVWGCGVCASPVWHAGSGEPGGVRAMVWQGMFTPAAREIDPEREEELRLAAQARGGSDW